MTSPTPRKTRRLPLLMRTVFQDLLLVTYAVEPAALAALLPPAVRPWTRGGRALVSIVIANMRGMRPAPLPEALGSNAYQVVYRAIVTPHTDGDNGRPARGVFFLRSDCNDPVLSFFGNRMTEFRFHYFHTGAIGLYRGQGDDLLASVETRDCGGDLVVHARDLGPAEEHPPADAALWPDVAAEKRDLVELFHAYAHDPERGLLYDMEIERGDWAIRRLDDPDTLGDGVFSAFFEEGPFTPDTARLVSNLYIRECAYVWKPVVERPLATRPRSSSS